MKHLKLLSICCCIFSFSFTWAQDLQWAVALREGSSDEENYVLLNDSVVLWGFKATQGDMISEFGIKTIIPYKKSSLILCFNLEGQLLWHKTFNYTATLQALCKTADGKIVALVSDPYETLLRKDVDWDNESDYNLNLITYSTSGEQIDITKLDDLNASSISIHSIESTPDNGFILSGESDEGLISKKHPNNTSGKESGDFVLALDKKGETLWLRNHRFIYSKWGRQGTGTQLAVNNKGWIFCAGTINQGATFNNGKIKILSTQSFKDKKKGVIPNEIYLSCYSPKGKLKWVISSKNKNILSRLLCDDDQIYLGYTSEESSGFQQNENRKEGHNVFVTAFSQKGEVNWQFNGLGKHFGDMRLLGQDKLAFIQEFYLFGTDSVAYNGYKIGPRDDLLITKLTTQGTFDELIKININVTSHNCELNLLADKAQNLYCIGKIWCALPYSLSLIDQSFPNYECYGGVQFIGKIK